jgi:dTDP-glucose 4,6-dehydratase
MPRLFITGGAGFIGSAFIKLALDQMPDCQVVNFDALTYAGNLENLEGVDDSRHHFVRGDIADRQSVIAALGAGADAIINFAAESHVDRSIASADEFLRTNVIGTQVLLDAARERRVPLFLQISTDEVLGSLPEDDAAFFIESSPLAPNNPYAASKAAAEHLVNAAHRTYGLNTIITRCGNNYGPRQFPEKLIPVALANALNDQPIPLYGDGLNVRDWIYVDDHCRAILSILESGRPGAVYHIGARNVRRNVDVVKDILEALGKSHALIRYVKDRPGHDRRYAIEPAKVEQELGWRPLETWESGLQKTIQWYAENSVWLVRAHNSEDGYYARQDRLEMDAR